MSEKQSIYHWVAENYARRAKDSPADRWSTAYTEQCRRGERESLFTPSGRDAPKSAPLIPIINEFQ